MSEREAPAEVVEQAVQNGEVESGLETEGWRAEFNPIADMLIHSEEEKIRRKEGWRVPLRTEECAFQINHLGENGRLVKIIYPTHDVFMELCLGTHEVVIPSLEENDVPVHDGKKGRKWNDDGVEVADKAGRRISKTAVLSKEQLKALSNIPDGSQIRGEDFAKKPHWVSILKKKSREF